MKDLYKQMIEQLGEDINRPGLRDTPQRAADALKFLTNGYHNNLEAIINNALFASDCDEIVILKDIELFSLCEHHLLPFIGKCHIGYIPNGQVLGISKFARIVDHFARRLQIQENLTKQIANCIKQVTNAKAVGVVLEAQHLCMMMRGVEKQHSKMTTSVMLGVFREQSRSRAEFLSLIQ